MNDIKLVCFDMDDTLIDQNSWYELNLALGVTEEEDKKMYNDYTSGTLSYADWLNKLVELYIARGLATEERVHQTLANFSFKDGAEDLVLYLQEKGYRLALISGSFSFLVDAVGEKLNIPLRKANAVLEFGKDAKLTGLQHGGDEARAKLNYLKEICTSIEVSLTDCVCIGDGGNDIEMFKATGRGITFSNAPEEIRRVAWKTVNNLSEIKNVL